MIRTIYLDNAAATRVDPRVLRAMARASRFCGNPSSLHSAGREVAEILNDARVGIARFLNARPDEIVLCASGSEANTLALCGVAQEIGSRGHIITTPVEHLSVLNPISMLEHAGMIVSRISVDANGAVAVDDVISAITPNTAIVSVMYANNEIGTIQPIMRIGRAISKWRRAHHSEYPLFHVDACQATAYLDMDVQRLCADLLTLNGSKVYGPSGAAALFVRRGTAVSPLILGGSQEGGRRAGTENIPAAVGLATALNLVRKSDRGKVSVLRDYLIAGLVKNFPDARINGPLGDMRLASNVSISIPDTNSERLLLDLDARGICAGSGSACTAHAVEPSHVLRAIGTPKKYLDGVLRFSLSRHTTRREINTLLRALPCVVAKVRAQKAKKR